MFVTVNAPTPASLEIPNVEPKIEVLDSKEFVNILPTIFAEAPKIAPLDCNVFTKALPEALSVDVLTILFADISLA